VNPVIQQEKTGCGIASAANILGKSYAEMKLIANDMGIFSTDQSLWSDTQFVRDLLAQSGVETSDIEVPFQSWSDLPDLALLSIKHHVDNGKNFWHWVVFKRINGSPMVLDSAAYLEENKRLDFDEMEPEWYIEVL
jgi:hypothetical protein